MQYRLQYGRLDCFGAVIQWQDWPPANGRYITRRVPLAARVTYNRNAWGGFMVVMQTFMANLKHAIANRETVSIGGGDFTPDELKAVIAEIEQLILKGGE